MKKDMIKAQKPPPSAGALSTTGALNPIVFKTIFQLLEHVIAESANERAALCEEANDSFKALEWKKLRLRDWALVSRDGQTICEVFLDKGQSWLQYDDFASRPGHRENQSIVSIDECLIVHKRILADTNLMSHFADNVVFEVGSAGEEPPLRAVEDFVAAIGLMVSIQKWTNSQKQDKHKGRLLNVLTEDAELPEKLAELTVIQIAVGAETRSFAIESIRHASLLLFHPENFSK